MIVGRGCLGLVTGELQAIRMHLRRAFDWAAERR
jgi:hypothetical protein